MKREEVVVWLLKIAWAKTIRTREHVVLNRTVQGSAGPSEFVRDCGHEQKQGKAKAARDEHTHFFYAFLLLVPLFSYACLFLSLTLIFWFLRPSPL